MANQTCNPSIITQALGIQATGPRTVIVVADDPIWNDSTSYEYMTLVASTDFGQSYLSRKDVPAGTPLTNKEYWLPVASYNAQLAAVMNMVRNRVKMFQTVSDMVNDSEASVGDVCLTLGFHDANDGGSAFYYVTESGTADGWSVIEGGGSYYNIVTPDELNLRCTGATPGNDCTSLLTSALSYCADKEIPLYIPAGTWNVTPFTLPNYVAVRGNIGDYSTQKDIEHTTNSTVLSFTPTSGTPCITLGYANNIHDMYVNANSLTITENRNLLAPVKDDTGDYGNWIIENVTVDNVTGIYMAKNGCEIRNVQVFGAYIGFMTLLGAKLTNCFANRCHTGYTTSSDAMMVNCNAQEVKGAGFTLNGNNNVLKACRVDSSFQYGVFINGNNNDVDVMGDFIGESLVYCDGSYNGVHATSKRFSVNHAVTGDSVTSQLSGLILVNGGSTSNKFDCVIGTEVFNGYQSAKQVAMFNNTSANGINTFITNINVPNFTPASGFTYNNLISTFGRTYPTDATASYMCVFSNAIVSATGGKYFGFSEDAYKAFPSA